MFWKTVINIGCVKKTLKVLTSHKQLHNDIGLGFESKILQLGIIIGVIMQLYSTNNLIYYQYIYFLINIQKTKTSKCNLCPWKWKKKVKWWKQINYQASKKKLDFLKFFRLLLTSTEDLMIHQCSLLCVVIFSSTFVYVVLYPQDLLLKAMLVLISSGKTKSIWTLSSLVNWTYMLTSPSDLSLKFLH